MRQYGLAIGFVGLAYSASECFSESLRGEQLLLPLLRLGMLRISKLNIS